MERYILELKDVSMKFEDSEALTHINLQIRHKEFVTLLGPSGCGKSTMLRILGGFLTPTSGHVFFDGKDVTDVPPYKRKLNTVFQKYALFPHLNIYDNIAFGLKIKQLPLDAIKEKVKGMLKLVNLEGFERRRVQYLSGGQQQRVAIARALVNEPEVLLLDEPLGALDLQLRKDMQIELKRMQQRLGITFLYVTHDQEEALTMSDRVIVMKEGIIQQDDTPINIYNEPINHYVADFIGEANMLYGVMRDDYKVECECNLWDCIDKGFEKDEYIELLIRPEDLEMVPEGQGQANGVVESVVFKGVHYEIVVRDDTGYDWIVQNTKNAAIGSRMGIEFIPGAIQIMRVSPEYRLQASFSQTGGGRLKGELWVSQDSEEYVKSGSGTMLAVPKLHTTAQGKHITTVFTEDNRRTWVLRTDEPLLMGEPVAIRYGAEADAPDDSEVA
jgi:spermidine/putrescine transport system ATP-binding protein